jgi:hypothetical protein
MAWEKNQICLSWPAAADLRLHQFKAVVLGAAGTVNLPMTDVTQKAIGILQNQPNLGEEAVVAVLGVSKAIANAAINAGVLVSPEWVDDVGDSGKVGATVATAYTLGITLSPADAEDDVISVLLGNIAVI